ncbi:MAG: hypothetical protein Q9220_003079 [cf. Caloplaca sp. 1 TL-2023]
MSNGQQILEATSPITFLAGYMSFALDEDLEQPMPWDTLEQPSMSFCFGRFPGTVTLSRYIGSLNRSPTAVGTSSKVMLRKMDITQILDRMRVLQDERETSFEPSLAEQAFLYGEVLFDPLPADNGRTLEQDIDALSSLLNDPVWVDFSKPEKQIIATYYANNAWDAPADAFLHQVLLGAELDRRICSLMVQSQQHTDTVKSTLPLKVTWNLAVSRRFIQNISLDAPACAGTIFTRPPILTSRTKFSHLEGILNVGYALKWPMMYRVEVRVREESKSEAIRCLWSDLSLTLLSGVVLPGPTASWMIMRCLLDCSPDHQDGLSGFEKMDPQTGVQYLANTYWYWESIVGKVLGAMHGSRSVAGWIGPCIYTHDLDRIQCVHILVKPVAERIRRRDLHTIAFRSDPIGFPRASYSVDEYDSVVPSFQKIVDTVRVEKLTLRRPLWGTGCEYDDADKCEVAVQVAHEGVSYPVRLSYDVSFIAAAACWAGPHLLFSGFMYKAVTVDQLINNHEWAGVSADHEPTEAGSTEDHEGDTVLLIEAYGCADNAVLARAWWVDSRQQILITR